MARMVRMEGTGPHKLEPKDKAVYICTCGLSQGFPMCDGSHKACTAERAGKLSIYDNDKKRIVEERDDT
jgi:CDGSH-type Zn-finger protein